MSDLVNFLEEIIQCLNQNEKTEEDVLWVGRGFGKFEKLNMSEKKRATWEDFRSKADFCYDPGFGWTYIPLDLVIVGKDFWLERGKYDGKEWWEFKTMPTEPVLTGGLDLSEVYEALEWMKNSREKWGKKGKQDDKEEDDFFEW